MKMQKPTDLREKIAQLISIRVGSNMPPMTTIEGDYENVVPLIEQHQVGGLLLFNGGQSESCAGTLSKLQKLTSVPMLVASDMERGSGQQIVDHTLWPHCLAFDALGDDAAKEVETLALWSAQQARDVGVHAFFSPVVDIHRNPLNPIIATRAFGTTADRVIELASAFVRGCRAAGVLTCGKHFPGHGNTVDDSHAALPVVQDDAETLTKTDLAPFKALAKTGVDMFMTAHVSYPALDASGLPATLSEPILTDLLRDELGFDGAVVSDSMKMDGVHVGQGKSEAELAIVAIKAGVDVLLDVSDVEAVITEIERACQSDEQLAKCIDRALSRAWAMKVKAFDDLRTLDAVSIQTAHDHAQEIADRSLTITLDREQIALPLESPKRMFALIINPNGDSAYTRTDVLRAALESQPSVVGARMLTNASDDEIEGVLELAAAADTCLVAILVKPAAWQTFGIPPQHEALVQQITASRPTIIVSLGTQEVLDAFPDASIGITTFSDVAVSQQALLNRLFGA